MVKEFQQITWDDVVEDDCRQLVRLAVREDLDRTNDWTTLALVPSDRTGRAAMVARQAGVLCGLKAVEVVLDEMESGLKLETTVADGDTIEAGTEIAGLEGSVRSLLICERTVLNFLGRLSGVATLTRQYVDAVAGTGVRVYDTRKTTPGWRRLEKYAVGCGGGYNHRTGLFDAVLVKDNHLAAQATHSPAEALERVREFLQKTAPGGRLEGMIIEVEVDTPEQLESVLAVKPDIVLLDNMTPEQLHKAVSLRDRLGPEVELEASGSVRLETIRQIAETGVERISVGALTHSARSLDVGLDWSSGKGD